jgi:hypothetical protein
VSDFWDLVLKTGVFPNDCLVFLRDGPGKVDGQLRHSVQRRWSAMSELSDRLQFVAPLADYCKTDAEGSLDSKNQCFGLLQNGQVCNFTAEGGMEAVDSGGIEV